MEKGETNTSRGVKTAQFSVMKVLGKALGEDHEVSFIEELEKKKIGGKKSMGGSQRA